jgi:hypothetical protein
LPLLQTNSSEQSSPEEQEAPRKSALVVDFDIIHGIAVLPAQCPAHEQDPPEDPPEDSDEAHFPLVQTRLSEQSLSEEQELPVISISVFSRYALSQEAKRTNTVTSP